MRTQCPDSACSNKKTSPAFRRPVRKGSYFRSSDAQRIPRFQCPVCRKTFSSATFGPCYRQKKRKLNHQLMLLVSSGVSQRRAAKILRTSRRTIERKFKFLAEQARLENERFLRSLPEHSIKNLQFDDLETSEHTKFKPLSVALVVEPTSRKILSFSVSQMPPKGLLAKKAFKRYGPRPDQRAKGWDQLFRSLLPIAHPEATWISDENPHYPKHLKRHHPSCIHETVKGQRGCVVGQGELKKVVYDPMFSLNHTCAMLRANMNRLFRRTWCTTKRISGLIDHLSIYVAYHNRVLTPKFAASLEACTG